MLTQGRYAEVVSVLTSVYVSGHGYIINVFETISASRSLGQFVGVDLNPNNMVLSEGDPLWAVPTQGQLNGVDYFVRYLAVSKTVTMPGVVVSGTGNTYLVDAYPGVFGVDPLRVTVKQLQIDNAATVPAGLAVMVTCLRLHTGAEYYMQAPIVRITS